jgi:hypothetical protein
MKALFAEIAATSWRDWLAIALEFAGIAVIVASITLIAIGFAPG